jgi:hypothetical protein
MTTHIGENKSIYDVIYVVPNFTRYYFTSSVENIARQQERNYVQNMMDSFERHYVSTFSDKINKLSTIARIENMCRDVFMSVDVQTFLSEYREPSSITSIIYATVTKKFDTSKVHFNSFCESNFPTPVMYLDKEDSSVKLQITKSMNYMNYKELADMLYLLYNTSQTNDLGYELNLKISKLNFLLKTMIHIENSSKQDSLLTDKLTNVFNKVHDFLSTFEDIEDMTGDPQLRQEIIEKRLRNHFESNLLEQETELNSLMTKTKIHSYMKPIISAAKGVSQPTIEYFGDTINELMTALHIDAKLLIVLITIIIGTVGAYGYFSRNHNRNRITSQDDIKEIKELRIMLQNIIEFQNYKTIQTLEEIKHL